MVNREPLWAPPSFDLTRTDRCWEFGSGIAWRGAERSRPSGEKLTGSPVRVHPPLRDDVIELPVCRSLASPHEEGRMTDVSRQRPRDVAALKILSEFPAA